MKVRIHIEGTWNFLRYTIGAVLSGWRINWRSFKVTTHKTEYSIEVYGKPAKPSVNLPAQENHNEIVWRSE